MANSAPLFVSKEEFFEHGLAVVDLEGPLDCSICHEPLATSSTTTSTASSQLPGAALQTGTVGTDEIVPETPVKILPCAHIFGATCLPAWFSSSSSNSCPLCNTILFAKRIHLAFCEPTRVMRLNFANMVEYVLGDVETAQEIREQLMSDWTRDLMRETMIEGQRAMGVHVTWEYVDQDLDGNVLEEDDSEEDDEYSSGDEESDEGCEEEGRADTGSEHGGVEERGDDDDVATVV